MKQQTQHDGLARLGEALLQEFASAQPQPVPAEFDRKCRNRIGRKSTGNQTVFWMARAAVLAFALVGMLTVAVLSIGPLRNGIVQLAASYSAPVQEEYTAEYTQISYATADNTALSVFYDGKESYQILLSDEFGQRLYGFLSPDVDEEFFHELGAQLAAAED